MLYLIICVFANDGILVADFEALTVITVQRKAAWA